MIPAPELVEGVEGNIIELKKTMRTKSKMSVSEVTETKDISKPFPEYGFFKIAKISPYNARRAILLFLTVFVVFN